MDGMTHLARALRASSTEAERRLWFALRDRRLGGHKFRRQVVIGRFIADFLCPAHRLVVELDGGQHGEGAARDAARTAWLEARGYRVLRFWNNDVLENMEGVLVRILAALQ
ncbi:MAG: endonuclease domain-containing protein [Alphaproteobacteria bacterium]|nr:endonuclease domain-containing protein [Alphaproteobacteria bacterium]